MIFSNLYRTVLTILWSALLLTNINAASAKSDNAVLSAKQLIEKADFNFDKELFLEAHGLCERILAAEPGNSDAEYYLAYTKYRLLLIGMTNKDKSAFSNYYPSAVSHAKNLAGNKEYKSEALTLQASIYMMKLAVDHSEGPALAPEIHALLDRAEKDNPENPRTHIVRAHMLKNTPEFFGGSLKGALREFEKSVTLFEKNPPDPSDVKPGWGHLEALVEIGNINTTLKNYEAAKQAYEKALELKPDYGYVKYKLLPELENKLSSAK